MSSRCVLNVVKSGFFEHTGEREIRLVLNAGKRGIILHSWKYLFLLDRIKKQMKEISMLKRFNAMLLVAMLVISFLTSACGYNASFASQPQGTTQQSTVQTTPTATPTPTIDGIPTPDYWVTVTIHMTEGGITFDPYKLYISATDIKGIIWANLSDREITLVNSDVPSSVTPSSLQIAPGGNQKLMLPKNQRGQYTFHIQTSDGLASSTHCTIIRE